MNFFSGRPLTSDLPHRTNVWTLSDVAKLSRRDVREIRELVVQAIAAAVGSCWSLPSNKRNSLSDLAHTTLREWFIEHFVSPYPSEMDKLNLAMKGGIEADVVKTWFANFRNRVWKKAIAQLLTLNGQILLEDIDGLHEFPVHSFTLMEDGRDEEVCESSQRDAVCSVVATFSPQQFEAWRSRFQSPSLELERAETGRQR